MLSVNSTQLTSAECRVQIDADADQSYVEFVNLAADLRI